MEWFMRRQNNIPSQHLGRQAISFKAVPTGKQPKPSSSVNALNSTFKTDQKQ